MIPRSPGCEGESVKLDDMCMASIHTGRNTTARATYTELLPARSRRTMGCGCLERDPGRDASASYVQHGSFMSAE
eukprot:3682634-Amphidinium_carterae.1